MNPLARFLDGRRPAQPGAAPLTTTVPLTTSSAPPSTTPLLATGSVRHRRLRPVAHAFAYPSRMLLLPLRSMGDGGPTGPLAPLRFDPRDHGEGGADALAWFDALLAAEGVADADGEVWLMTHPRILGYAFKPVSFWFAHRRDGSLAAVLAEVHNTFGDRHAYLIAGPQLGWGRTLAARKVLHVSPFCAVAGEYRFRFLRSAGRIVARIVLHDAEGPLLVTSVTGALAPLTRARAWRALLGAPLASLAVSLRIHWQALRLWRAGVPVHRRPAPPSSYVTR